jgi:hypothetical protein
MNDYITQAGYVKRRAETVDTGSTDLFDKIINLKFVRASGASFALRSDYEPVYYGDGTVSFKPCMFKPQIKVAYKQVSNDVAIQVDIEVTNLFFYAKNSNADKAISTDIYKTEGDPVTQIVIQMGYRAQFPDWADETHRQPGYADRFFDLENSAVNSPQEAKLAFRQITVLVLASWPSGHPPDQVSYFKGIIGSDDKALTWNRTEEESARGFGYEGTPTVNPETGSPYTPLEWTLFNFITRRFVRSDVLHLTRVNTGTEEREVLIYGRAADLAGAVPLSGPLADPGWFRLVLAADGLMSETDARKFGVVCKVSKYLRSRRWLTYRPYGLEEFALPLMGLDVRRFSEQHEKLGAQLHAIQEAYNKIRWYQLADGNFYVYSADEGGDDFFADPETLRNQENAIKLPAVYEISLSGLRTIKCPFIAFVSPMTTVLFKSRYSIGSLVGFYYHPKDTDAFLVLQASISFDTTGEENTMELMCVDIPAPAAPKAEGAAVKPSLEIEEPEPPGERKPLWTKAEAVAGEYNFTESFAVFARHYLLGNVKNPETNESYWETEPDLPRMLTDIKEWNGELFSGYKSGERWAEPLSEDRLYHAAAGFHIPRIIPGDVIKYRIPYRPDYPPGEEARG